MNTKQFKEVCLGLPGATANVQWGEDLVFKVGGKMFAVVWPSEGTIKSFSFKTSPESFHILTQEPGIVPSPYLARSHWVRVTGLNILPGAQLAQYLERSYRLVVSGLPKRTQAALANEIAKPTPKRKRS
jgi:predicted DNA-binding protein (MmcQ/YjbR family)